MLLKSFRRVYPSIDRSIKGKNQSKRENNPTYYMIYDISDDQIVIFASVKQ